MDGKPVVYLDWNIINKLWSPSAQREEDRADFAQLETHLENSALIAPYSNAHMRDSARGVVKHPQYARSDAAVITLATNNLCITQYWGEKTVKWHYRDAAEFLDATVNDKEFVAASFSELFSNPDMGEAGPTLQSLHLLRVSLLDMQQLPDSFRQCYKADPIFSLMFPKTKVRNTMKALCEDLYDFGRVIMSDHVLYKQFRKFLNNAKARSVEVRKVSSKMGDITEAKPDYLDWEELWEQVKPKAQTSSNENYEKIVDLYTRTDLKGYHPDERFSNMIDDALHTFYGAHCDYFVTMDKRCLAKAKKIYSDLKIASKAFSLSEFIEAQAQPA